MKKLHKKQTTLIIAISVCACILLLFIISLLNNTHFNSNITDVTIEVGTNYTCEQPQLTLSGNLFFRTPKNIKVKSSGKFDTSKVGDYEIIYTGSYLFYFYDCTQTIHVIDSVAPIITLNTIDGYYTSPGAEYKEEGFTAIDNYDGDITGNVHSEIKDGVVYYTVKDSSGNIGTAERTIVYDDKIPPEITLSGETSISIDAGTAFEEPGFTAVDNIDGDITDSVTIDNPINIYAAGTYTITYTATDSYGNSTNATRSITVNPIKNNVTTVTPDCKVIYLTFDDGPGPYTEQLLDILAKYNVKATFFVVNSSYNDLIGREYAAGHSVGVHSYSHDYSKIYSSSDAYWNDFNAMKNVIKQQTGADVSIFRFPGGSSNSISKKYCSGIMSQLAFNATSMGYQYFDWNVSSGDAGGTTDTNQVYNNIISGVANKTAAIVLQHDIKAFSVAAVEQTIIWGLNNGYTFLPLDSSSPAAHQHISN